MPVPLPDMPVPVRFNDTEAVFDLNGMRSLERLRIASETNFLVAKSNALALDAQSRAYNSLIDAGKLQRQVAEIRAELLAIERRDHFIDVWFHRGIIVLGAMAVAL